MGKKFGLEVEILSKPREAYRGEDYLASGMPMAPALMLAGELLIQGCSISEEALESEIRRRLKAP